MVELKKGARMVGVARDTLATTLRAEYEQGATIRDLAERTGRSYGFVQRVLAEAGVTRARGKAKRTNDDVVVGDEA
jgi:lambda repressor-like predicted transcriptional regulator